jgi:hypothetical protein
MYQQPALKGRNPAIDSMPPFQGYGRETAFIHRALPCAVDCRAFSPSSARREAVSKALFRHCERSEAIHKSWLMNRIASVFDLAMTVKRAFDTPSEKNGTGYSMNINT